MARRSLCVTGAASVAALALVATGCGSGGSNSASSTTTTASTATTPAAGANTAASQAFRTCLTQHGVKVFTPGGGRPSAGGTPGGTRTPAQQQAFSACRSKLPAGGLPGRGGAGGGRSNPAFAKYTACLKQHGVTLGASNNQKAFAKASAACAKYRPAATGGTAAQ